MGFEPTCPEGKRFSRLLRVVVSSGYFMAAWLILVPLKSLSHKAFCLVLNRSNPNRIGSNRTAFLKISLKSLTFERIWRELDTKKSKMQYSEVGLYWREFSQSQERNFMKYDLTAIQNLPDTFSLQDLCRVCHISKRDGRYYLQSELIPCTYTGKKTRCYQIRKKDLLKTLKDYDERPQKYVVPRKWRENGVLCRKRLQPVIYLPPQDVSSETAKAYYQKKLDDQPDLLCAVQVMMITGYSRRTITRWCDQKNVRTLARNPRVWIPKEELYRFLISDIYNNIPAKSKEHLEDIRLIYKAIHKGN